MTRKHIHHQPQADGHVEPDGRSETPADTPVPAAPASDESATPVASSQPAPPVSLVEQPEQEILRLTDQLEEAKDRYLRLAAEYDNFRKRTVREREEIGSRAQARVVSSILDALDDLGRVAGVDPAKASTSDILTGVQLVERKILRELESAGLERVGTLGEPFDPHLHEALGSVPAETPEQDHQVASVYQPGYRFGGALLRPARVQIYQWRDGAAPQGEE